jgi:hypothetical protein
VQGFRDSEICIYLVAAWEWGEETQGFVDDGADITLVVVESGTFITSVGPAARGAKLGGGGLEHV